MLSIHVVQDIIDNEISFLYADWNTEDRNTETGLTSS